MAAFSPFSFQVLFEAWRHAEKVAVLAERQWILALERPVIDPQKESDRKIELVAARETASMIFQQAFNAATPDSRSI